MKFRRILILSVLFILASEIAGQVPQAGRSPRRGLQNRSSFFPFRKKPSKEQKRQLQPRAEDLARYTNFLARENAGIFRLLPDLGCQDSALVLRADETCLNAIPESSFYSFREDEHTSETLADVRIKNNNFVTDGLLSQGILVNLGDVELEKTDINSKGFRFLNAYKPSELSPEAAKQSFEILRGINFDGYHYKKILPAVENNTYALRVVAYRGSLYRSYRGYLFDLLAGDKRIDITVAFRVVRKEPDGSLTLLWKELSRKDSPKLKYPKKNKKA